MRINEAIDISLTTLPNMLSLLLLGLASGSPGNEPLCGVPGYCSAGAVPAYYRGDTSEHVCYASCLALGEECSGYYTVSGQDLVASRCYVLRGECTAFKPQAKDDGYDYRYWEVACPDPDEE